MLTIQFRILLPVVYVAIEALLLGMCFLSLGHGYVCEYIYLLMKPVYYVIPRIYILGLVLAFLGGAAQYFLLGIAIDAILRRRQHNVAG